MRMKLHAQAKSPYNSMLCKNFYCYESVLKGHFQGEHYFVPNGGQPSILYVSQNVSVIMLRLNFSNLAKYVRCSLMLGEKLKVQSFHCFHLRDKKGLKIS